MIEYFPGVYWPNLMFCNTVACGATLGDVDDACRSALRVMHGGKGEGSPEFKQALHDGFTSVGSRLERLISEDEREGRRMSAGEKQIRATAIYLTLEFLMDDFYDPLKARMFDRYRASLRKALALAGPPHNRVEFVQIPYAHLTLDGMFIPAAGVRHAPVVIHINGSHSTMEWPYLTGFVDDLAARGVSSLTFDHPGSGSARYHKGLKYRYDSEVYVSAAIDYLENRKDVDSSRVGVCGASFGGYFAPRAAVFESRIKACICWGGNHDPRRRFAKLSPDGSVPAELEELMRQSRWQFGASDNRELYKIVQNFTLDGVIEKLKVPLYIVHGKNDVQTPLDQAERTVQEAVSSPRAELLVIGPEDGGDQHCNIDNHPTACNAMADWAAETLGSGGGDGQNHSRSERMTS